MKKITLLFLLLITGTFSYSQCTNEFPFPAALSSNNQGLPQVITTCTFNNTFAEINSILVGEDYVFSCYLDDTVDVDKYITVTNLDNVVIAHGTSPLTVTNIAVSSVRAHYSQTAICGTFLDDCNTSTVAIILSCPIPIDVAASGITTSSADFTWTAGGTETTWEVIVLPAGTAAPTNTASGMTVLSNMHSEFGLIAASTYDFYIRANCGSEFSPWSAPFSFVSGCNAITAFNENFDTVITPALPTCWTGLINGVGASTSASVTTTNFDAFSPENMVSLYNADAATTANVALVSPNLSNLAAGTHRLKFFAKGTGSLQVGTFSSNTNDAVFTSFQTIAVSTNYAEYVINFTTYTGTNTYIGIRNNSDEFNSINIDNVKWELNPLCPDVTAINVPAVSANSATINWTAGGSESIWDVVFAETSVTDPTTLTPVAPQTSGTPQVVLTSLIDNTNYNVWVRTVCGSPNGNGSWIGPVVFKTACLPTASFNENFDSSVGANLPDCWSTILSGSGIDANAYISGNDFTFNSPSRAVELNNAVSSMATSNIILVSPLLNNLSAGTHRLKLFARSFGASSIQIGTLSSTTNSAVFTSLQTIAITANFQEYIVDFTTYSGTDTFIGIRQNSTNVFESIFIDDVKWETAPLCGDVSGLNLSGLTTNTATLSWLASNSSGETQWDVVLGDVSATNPDLLTPISPAPTTTSALISGLTSNTSYNFWVRSACGAPNGNGFWIGPFSFQTPCDAISTFNENFEASENGNLPNCWSSILSGATISNFASITTVDNGYLGGKAIELNNDSSNATDKVILVSPNVNTIVPGTHRVRFFAKSNFGTPTLQIGSLNNTLSNATFSLFQEITLSDQYQEFIVDFSGYMGSNTYLAFRNANNSYNTILIDNIRWIPSPLCADVSQLAVANVTQNSGQIQWNGTGTSNWQVALGGLNDEDPSALTPSAVLSATTFTFTDLTPDTSFNIWVRSVCSAPIGNGDWIGPISFKTNCMPAAVESTIVQSFETESELPSCWTSELTVGTNNWQTKEVYEWESITTTVTGTKVMFKENFNSTALLFSLPYNFSALNAANTAKVNLNLHRHQFASPTDRYTVYVNTTASLTGATQLLEQNSLTTAQTGFYNYVLNIPISFNGLSQVFIIIKGETIDGFASLPLAIDDFKIEVEGQLSTPDFKVDHLKYYPNPVTDVLNIVDNETIFGVVIYNLLGQQVLRQHSNANSLQLDLSALAKGGYIMHVNTNTGNKTVKIIKK
jgi:hypothetical protein